MSLLVNQIAKIKTNYIHINNYNNSSSNNNNSKLIKTNCIQMMKI